MKKLLLIALLLTATILQGQPDTTWTKTFGSNQSDWCPSTKQTDDNGYIFVYNGGDYYTGSGIFLVKTDSIGNQMWSKHFGEYAHKAFEVEQTNDGGYIIIGTDSHIGQGDALLIKTDYLGDTLWTKQFDSTDSGNQSCVGYSVEQTDDGGYAFIMSKPQYRFAFIKTDSTGSQEWSQIYDIYIELDNSGARPSGIYFQQTQDGGYAIISSTYSYVNSIDYYFIKTNSIGEIQWSQTYGGSEVDIGRYFQQTEDGGYIIVGYTGGENNLYDIWLIKTDSDGNEEWNNTFHSGNDKGYFVQQTIDGGYIIIGTKRNSSAMENDVWLIKTNSDGNEEWNKVIGGSGIDYGFSGQQTEDGGYIIGGATNSYGNGEFDVWLIKTDSDGVVEIESKPISPNTYNIHQNHPNPFNPKTTLHYDLPEDAMVNITIYDMMGRVIKTMVNSQQNAGFKSIQWDATNNQGQPVSAGVYLYSIEAGEFRQTKKMVLLK
jgi:hypothetical protein